MKKLSENIKDRLLVPLLALLCVGLFAGCRTTPSQPIPRELPSTVVVDEDAFSTAEFKDLRFTVSVEVKPLDDGAKTLARSLKTSIERELDNRNLNVEDKNSDFKVDVDVATTLFDKTGNFYKYNGEVNASLKDSGSAELLGRERFTAQSERVLDQAPALKQLAQTLGEDTATWVGDTTFKEADVLKAAEIRVERKGLKILGNKFNSEFVDLFISEVSKLDAVKHVSLVSSNEKTQSGTFKVVYVAKKLPGGLENAVKGIKKLNIK